MHQGRTQCQLAKSVEEKRPSVTFSGADQTKNRGRTGRRFRRLIFFKKKIIKPAKKPRMSTRTATSLKSNICPDGTDSSFAQQRPSGRFDALIDMGNPMKGINILPFLRRSLEGRALKAMGPFEVLELSRTICEEAAPRRWPRKVIFKARSYLCYILPPHLLTR
jgi:hypothetical protein